MKFQCAACGSSRIISGILCDSGRDYTTFFMHDYKKKFLRLKTPFVHAGQDATICLDCGSLWSRVDTGAAREMVAEYGTDELRKRVGIQRE